MSVLGKDGSLKPALTGLAGASIEWYDFFIYATAAALIWMHRRAGFSWRDEWNRRVIGLVSTDIPREDGPLHHGRMRADIEIR